MTYAQILPYLIKKGLVERKPLPPVPTPPPCNFDINARCDYHAGSPGHTTKKCIAFKYKVKDLLKHKIIYFTTENPNIKNNPIPGHAGPTINVVEVSEDNVLIRKINQVKTHMTRIHEKLIGYEKFEKLHANCEVCLLNLDKCKKVKKCLQLMMDQGLVQIGY